MRIISGSAKGRILKSPKGMLTRPTLDRTRESLFNILANGVLEGASVLDIFAGTGALGLEALSRGAAHCVFIDHYTQALIRQNAELCGFGGQYEILRMEASAWRPARPWRGCRDVNFNIFLRIHRIIRIW